MLKILYLIVTADEFPYIQLKQTGKNTWQTRLSQFDNVIHLYSSCILGQSELNRDAFLHEEGVDILESRKIEDPIKTTTDDWTFPTFDGWDSILHKTVSAFDFALAKLDFDYVVRTAPSSFWNPSALRRLLSSEKRAAAFGTVRKHYAIEYIEGSNLILSKDIVKKIVSNVNILDFGLIDDVALGKQMQELSIPMIDWPRPRIEFLSDFYDKRYGEFGEIYSFRCRVSKPYSKLILHRETRNLKKLHKILLSTKKY